MKSIPGYPGHAWAIEASDDQQRPIRVRFARHRGGEADTLLRKPTRHAQDGAAPWVIRYWEAGRETWRRVSPQVGAPWMTDGIVAAIRNALDQLAIVAQGRDPYAAARAAAAYRARLTLQILADEWITLGMPSPAGAPRTDPQRRRMRPFLDQALTWWGSRDPAACTQRTMRDYHAHRAATSPRGSCSRAVDLELVTLSNLCAWAVADERLTANPFAQRPRFRAAAQVAHSSERMPQSDEDLHAIIGWLLDRHGRHQVAGAYLMLQALTGLRPGEPSALRRDARALAREIEPGHIWAHPDGRRLLSVRRSKSGVNPGIPIHPALESFLAAWLPHAAHTWPDSPWWFPRPSDPREPLVPFADSTSSTLGDLLEEACEATGRPHCAPHGMRAFATRCYLSRGDDFATVAITLGQRSGAALVAKAYSHLSNVVGDGRFDWLPGDGSAPCWSRLLQPPSNVVPFTSRLRLCNAHSFIQ